MEAISNLVIRPVTESDIPDLLALVRELADYEHLLDILIADDELYRKALFGECPVAEALIAHYNGEPAAYAIFFHSFSSFLGRAGIYLEDIFVRPHLRGKGIGKTLFTTVAKIASDRNCGRMEWTVLKWNKPAIDFYEAHGAESLDGWTTMRLTGEALAKVAEEYPEDAAFEG